MTNKFTHLHLHTQYSLLDGANKITNVIKRAKELGQEAIGITDHGNMHGVLEFYETANKEGIKPIIGCELYVANGSRFSKERIEGERNAYHLTVIAKDLVGYRNLCKLSSLAYREGFYKKPRVDHEILQQFNKGLIVLSGCLGSELGQCSVRGDESQARQLIEFYAKTFDGRYYLELQPHDFDEQKNLNKLAIRLGKEYGLPLVATGDCHYTNKDDHFAQEVLMCVSMGKTIDDPTRVRHDHATLHLKSGDEMATEIGVQEAISNSVSISNACELSLETNKYYMPIVADNEAAELTKRVDAALSSFGLLNLYEYMSRAYYELGVINKMGFAGYFLIVADFINWAKNNNIPVGVGRGSVAGSLVAYLLGITGVNPIQHDLLFERFLNPERVSLPDIDVDFCIEGRDKVIQYVTNKYGKHRVAQIVTFGTLKAKAAIKDVGRALGISYTETDRVAQLVPAPRQGFDYPLAESLKMEPKLQEYANGEGKQLISLAMKLEGLTRHSSTHAAGVVIGDRPLIDMLPMMVDKEGNDVTQYSMKYVEKVGLVKFDFLGLKTLTVLHTAAKMAKFDGLNIISAQLEDWRVYEQLSFGDTIGVFQLESGGITELVSRLKPTKFTHLVDILALYRPGVLNSGMVENYINRHLGKESVSYAHPMMEPILKDTYGIMIYQEQIMELARMLGDYSLGEADILRRAMGKKNPKEMEEQRSRFVEGCKDNDIDQETANHIFEQMSEFAKYGFNRSHSVAYAIITYQTAYMKAYFPIQFMAALMSLDAGDTDKTLKYLRYCRQKGIKVLPPDINKSDYGFTVDGSSIRFGLGAVKGLGESSIKTIVDNRMGGYENYEAFARRNNKLLSNKTHEALIKCGAFDSMRLARRALFDNYKDIITLVKRKESAKAENLCKPLVAVEGKDIGTAEWISSIKLKNEHEALGFYISGHPLTAYEKYLNEKKVPNIASLAQSGSYEAAGVVTGLTLKNTKKGDKYASFTLEDDSGAIEALVWPSVYNKVGKFLGDGEPVLVSGSIENKEERLTLVVDNICSLSKIRNESAKEAIIYIDEIEAPLMPELKKALALHRDSKGCIATVIINVNGGIYKFKLCDENNIPVVVRPSELLCSDLEAVFGRQVLFLI